MGTESYLPTQLDSYLFSRCPRDGALMMMTPMRKRMMSPAESWPCLALDIPTNETCCRLAESFYRQRLGGQRSSDFCSRPNILVNKERYEELRDGEGDFLSDTVHCITVVTICTASLTFSNSTFCPHSVFVCFVWI